MKKKGNMTTPKEHNNFPVTKFKEMEIYELPDTQFKELFQGSSASNKEAKINNSNK